MTISTEPSPLSYAGDGTTTDFAITWKYFAKSHVVSTLRDSSGAETTWVLDTDYTLTDADVDSGGTLTAITIPASGETLLIDLDPPNTQGKGLPLGGAFPSPAVEDAIDLLTQLASRNEFLWDRTLRVPRTDNITGDDLEMPIESDRAGKYMVFTPSGKPSYTDGTGTDNTLRSDIASNDIDDGTKARNLVAIPPISSGDTNIKNIGLGRGDLLRYIPFSLHESMRDDSNTTDLIEYWDNALASLAATAADGRYRTSLKAVSGFYKFVTGLTMPQYLDFSGEGRWNTRLVFALTAAGTAINMEGTTGARMWSTLRKMRVDGSACTDANVIGISVDWIQDQQPLLDEVTIFGGYEVGGASTGFKNGLVFKEDGNNWIASFDGLGIEGCHGDGLIIDTLAAGHSNIITFNDGRVENNKERNIYIIGQGNDINSQQINFNNYTIEGASYGNTGVQSSVHVEGVKAGFANTYFEGNATPNWVDYEVYIPSGDISLHNCVWNYCQRCLYVGGRVSISGNTKMRTPVAAITLAAGGYLNITGNIEFFGGGTPIVFNDGTSTLDWVRENLIVKTSNYTVTSGDIGSTFSNHGAKQNIVLVMANSPNGSTFTFTNGLTSILNSTYKWTLSGSGTGEYYLELAAGGDPGFAKPAMFYEYATSMSEGTVGSLAAQEWDYADNDTLGYSTLYYRNPTDTDPDAGSVDSMFVGYTIQLTPTNLQRLPLPSTTPSDTIVTDGVPGTSMKMRNMAANFWVSEAENGTWT